MKTFTVDYGDVFECVMKSAIDVVRQRDGGKNAAFVGVFGLL